MDIMVMQPIISGFMFPHTFQLFLSVNVAKGTIAGPLVLIKELTGVDLHRHVLSFLSVCYLSHAVV